MGLHAVSDKGGCEMETMSDVMPMGWIICTGTWVGTCEGARPADALT